MELSRLTDPEKELYQAQKIVNAYGHVLANLSDGTWAHPISSLPYDPDTIKNAIHLLLWELKGQDKIICNSLAQSYVFLCQFIDDDDADMVNNSQNMLQSSDFDQEGLINAEQAQGIINRIKLDMETLMEDVKVFIE